MPMSKKGSHLILKVHFNQKGQFVGATILY